MRKTHTRSGLENAAQNRPVALVKPSFARRFGIVILPALLFLAWIHPVGGQATMAVEPVAVRTTQPQKVTLKRSTTQPGTVCAFFEAELYAKVGGYLKKLYVDIGD